MPVTRSIVLVGTTALALQAVLCIAAEKESQEQPAQHLSQNNTPVRASGDFSWRVEIGGGRKMFLECSRSGTPTVILESL